YGFGYDSDEYRVVYVTQTLIDGENCVDSQVLNYGVSSDTSTVVKIPYRINAELNAEGVFVGPAIHWPAFRFNNSSGPLIIGFNLKSNKTKEIPLPEDARFRNPLQVGKLKDSLCIIDSCVGAYLDVWIMNNYAVKESWERLFRVERKQSMHVYSLRLLGFSMDSEHVLMQIDSQTLVWVDVKAKTMEEVELNGLDEEDRFDSHMFYGSLVEPCHKFNSLEEEAAEEGEAEEEAEEAVAQEVEEAVEDEAAAAEEAVEDEAEEKEEEEGGMRLLWANFR
ncbi:F-box/kelch-repeat protein At3g06240, partial [Linum perenne]